MLAIGQIIFIIYVIIYLREKYEKRKEYDNDIY